jgi:hypothetical protein
MQAEIPGPKLGLINDRTLRPSITNTRLESLLARTRHNMQKTFETRPKDQGGCIPPRMHKPALPPPKLAFTCPPWGKPDLRGTCTSEGGWGIPLGELPGVLYRAPTVTKPADIWKQSGEGARGHGAKLHTMPSFSKPSSLLLVHTVTQGRGQAAWPGQSCTGSCSLGALGLSLLDLGSIPLGAPTCPSLLGRLLKVSLGWPR